MLNIPTAYAKSEYEKELESSIDANLSSISANDTSIDGKITTLSGNITTLSGNITTLSGNITALNDFVSIVVSSAIFTLPLSTYRNFTITNADTAGKTLKIASAPTATDTMLNVNVKLDFTTTATITYTGTITWQAATAPNPTAVGTFIVNLKSFDAGANWFSSYTGLH